MKGNAMRTKTRVFFVDINDHDDFSISGSWKDLRFCNKNSKALEALVIERNVKYKITTKERFFGLIQTYTVQKQS